MTFPIILEYNGQMKDPIEEQVARSNLIMNSWFVLAQYVDGTGPKEYIGKGLPPIPLSLAGKSGFIDMEKMVPELWLSTYQKGKAKSQIIG